MLCFFKINCPLKISGSKPAASVTMLNIYDLKASSKIDNENWEEGSIACAPVFPGRADISSRKQEKQEDDKNKIISAS